MYSSGAVVGLARSIGATSGRFAVAGIIARVFPAHKAFVAGVRTLFGEPESTYPSGPYAADRLSYKSGEVVEYHTPADTEGLGTSFPLKKGPLAMRGVAILINGDPPDVVLLSVRLPPDLTALGPAISRQFASLNRHGQSG